MDEHLFEESVSLRLSQPSSLSLRLHEGQNVSFTDWALHISEQKIKEKASQKRWKGGVKDRNLMIERWGLARNSTRT